MDSKGGLYVIGGVLIGDLKELHTNLERLRSSITSGSIATKAFPDVTVARNFRTGVQNDALTGGMKPNTVVLPLLGGSKFTAIAVVGSFAISCSPGPREFVNVVNDVLVVRKNVVVACNFSNDNFMSTPPSNSHDLSLPLLGGSGASALRAETLDVWVLDSNATLEGTLSLQLQLAYILHAKWKMSGKIRVIRVIANSDVENGSEDDEDTIRARLESILIETRIDAHPMVLRESAQGLNAMMRKHSAETRVLIACLPGGHDDVDSADVRARVAAAHQGAPAVRAVRAGQMQNIITNEI